MGKGESVAVWVVEEEGEGGDEGEGGKGEVVGRRRVGEGREVGVLPPTPGEAPPWVALPPPIGDTVPP